MKELMIAVERVVRPVRANPRRKMKMRQELLAHLASAYEEGRARLGNDGAASEEAVRRFGNPADLTRDLQASVPFHERVLFSPLPGTKWMTAFERYMEAKQGEAPSRRLGLWTWLWFLSILALSLTPAIILYQSNYGAILASEWFAVTAGMLGVFIVGVHAMHRELSGALRFTAVLRATGFAALAVGAPAVAGAAMFHWMLDIPIRYGMTAAAVFVSLLFLLGVSFGARYLDEANRRREEWTKLEIGD